MKNSLTLLGVLAAAIGIIGCSAFSNGGAPTAVERSIYNVRTNYLEVAVVHTNVIPISTFVTNVVPITIGESKVIYTTNVIGTTNFVTTTTYFTNEVPQYIFTVKTNVDTGIGTVGTVVNTFLPGMGGIVSTGLTALLGVWGYLRSSKQSAQNYNTASVLAQNIETIRAFIQGMPNGGKIDTAFTQYIQAHQADEGVLQNVLSVIQNEVSNPDARIAAQELANTVNALGTATAAPPIPPNQPVSH